MKQLSKKWHIYVFLGERVLQTSHFLDRKDGFWDIQCACGARGSRGQLGMGAFVGHELTCRELLGDSFQVIQLSQVISSKKRMIYLIYIYII